MIVVGALVVVGDDAVSVRKVQPKMRMALAESRRRRAARMPCFVRPVSSRSRVQKETPEGWGPPLTAAAAKRNLQLAVMVSGQPWLGRVP